jgi:hypothetical protein
VRISQCLEERRWTLTVEINGTNEQCHGIKGWLRRD